MSSYKNDQLDKIYKKLPKLNCKQLCHHSCGVFPIGTHEQKRIENKLGKNPFPSPEIILEKLQTKTFDLTCSLLKEGKCEIYRIRPLICRLFGLVKKMSCPFGCVPERWLTDKEAQNFLKKANYFDDK